MTQEFAGKIKLGVGDQVFMVGRFIGHDGKQRNAPLVRFGSIAGMPSEPFEYQLGGKRHDQMSIVADIRSIGGYSGSPVFLNENQLYRRPDGGVIDKHWLVGIDWGHVKMWSPVCGPDEEPVGNTQVNVNSGMAGIVPAWKLLDILMIDKLKSDRKRGEEDWHRAQKSGASPDVAGGPVVSQPKGANPQHREDFTALLGEAAQKPKPAE
jgi:hypothetical protein